MALVSNTLVARKAVSATAFLGAGIMVLGLCLSGCNKPEPEASPTPAGTPMPQVPDKMDSIMPGGGPPTQKK